MRLSIFGRRSLVAKAPLNELVMNCIFGLIEHDPAGLRVDMNSVAQEKMPNLPAALAHKLAALISPHTTRDELDSLYASLELDELGTPALRNTLALALAIHPGRSTYGTLYHAVRIAIDQRDQIRVHTTSEEGHVCRVTTYWQDIAEQQAREKLAAEPK